MKDGQLMRMPYHEYLKTDHWATMRRLKLEEADGRCQVCNETGILDVHHRTYDRRGHERLSDLTVLCRACHERHHGKTIDLDSDQETRSIARALDLVAHDPDPDRRRAALGKLPFSLVSLDAAWSGICAHVRMCRPTVGAALCEAVVTGCQLDEVILTFPAGAELKAALLSARGMLDPLAAELARRWGFSGVIRVEVSVDEKVDVLEEVLRRKALRRALVEAVRQNGGNV